MDSENETVRYQHPGDEFECFTNTCERLATYLSGVDCALQDRQHEKYLARWTKGPPMATEKHSVEELESWGMFGLYRRKDGSDWNGALDDLFEKLPGNEESPDAT